MNLENSIQAYHEALAAKAAADAALAQHKHLLDAQRIANAAVKDAHARLNAVAVAQFGRTGEKVIVPEQIVVKVYRGVSPYDRAEITEWAKRDALVLLTLDAKRFERGVRDGFFNVTGVHITETPKINILKGFPAPTVASV